MGCEEGEYADLIREALERDPNYSFEDYAAGITPQRYIDRVLSGPTADYCPTTRAGAFRGSGEEGEGQEFLDYLIENYPEECGYAFRRWNQESISQLRNAITDVENGRIPRCHPSDCATASYLALLERIRGTPHYDRLKDLGGLNMGGTLYRTFVQEPNSIVRTFDGLGLGDHRIISPMNNAQMQRHNAEGWPSAGDFVLLNRKSRPGRSATGHMTVFSHYQDGPRGKEICYWSSNSGTRGMGTQCERVSTLGSIHVGRVSDG